MLWLHCGVAHFFAAFLPALNPAICIESAFINQLSNKKRLGPKRDGISRGGFWLRAVLFSAVLAIPLIAGLSGPSMAGKTWRGVLQGNHSAVQSSTAARGKNGPRGDEKPQASGGVVDFGSHSVSLFNPITRGQLQADFHLEGVAVLNDGPALQKVVKSKYRFIREQAMIAVRNSNAAELEDPRRKLLQRRILIRINRSLEQPLLKSVTLSKFKLSEAAPEIDLLGEN